ncbi:MAG: cobyrinate a,c-diamide synthase [Pseudomonadota bacterium]
MLNNSALQSNGMIISAIDSNCGKTTITAMLLAAFTQRKLNLQPYKIGADFFDSGMHCMYSNEVSLNLDTWMMGKNNVQGIINRLPVGYRGIIEGFEGIFDKHYPDANQSGTMEIAQLLNWPIILVVCCEQLHQDNFSELLGVVNQAGKYHNNSRVAGIILNKVTKPQLTEQFIHYLAQHEIKVLGSINKQNSLDHPTDMHNAASSCSQYCPSMEQLAQLAEKSLSIDEIITLSIEVKTADCAVLAKKNSKNSIKKRIAISDDEAFFFYYQDNHHFLTERNVKLIKFSTLKDKKLPDNLDGLILSGGIPEKYAKEITNNQELRRDIKKKVDAGLLCYAECGGLMFLCQGIYLRSGQFYPMVGCVPGIVELTNKLQNYGYAICQRKINNEIYRIRGHEFHYASWLEEYKLANLWQTTTCETKLTRYEGYQTKNIHASFVHLYFPSASTFICNFFGLDE